MRKLYDIDADIENFEFDIDEETGEILNADGLDELHMEREQKVEGVGLKIKNLEAEKEAVKHEKESFATREKRLDKEITGYKEWLKYALKEKPFKTNRLEVTFRKSESVDIPDETKISDAYCNISVVRKPDKAVIKKALKEGKEVFGASLIEKQNISVK